MCGIAGFFTKLPLTPEHIDGDLPRMAASLVHRGPDDEGLWHDAQAGIALCHRRLAIIDLSATGHQPMHSASSRYTIVYNGEIYNYQELRKELASRQCAFVGGSDTEVLLAAIEVWGVQGAIERCKGMFAFALWDRRDRRLYLARDRFGEKPLYYGVCGDALLFASELKSLRQHTLWSDRIDRNALALMMQRDFVPAPLSIFQGIGKVMPGCFVSIQVRADRFEMQEQRYWDAGALIEEAANAAPLDEAQSLDLVGAALGRSIERQMVADVPVGAFLSGGIDSSLIVALMRKATSRQVRTFSIGFQEEAYNEAPFARAVSKHLDTRHTEVIVTPQECLNVIEHLPRIYDEPFGDSSQIPTYLVCKLAREAVTVCLSGDAGDELFAGYGRYRTALARWNSLKRWPTSMRAGASALLDRLPLSALEIAVTPAAFIWTRYGKEGLADRMQDHSSRWRAQNLRDFYRIGLRRWPVSSQLVVGRTLQDDHDIIPHLTAADGMKQMMHLDTCEYLSDDILVKVDRAAMAVSLETRIPMLDPDVARAAWRVPSSVLLRDGRGKWVLRELLRRHLPNELIDRPKKGFAVPIARWLRAELRPWANELLEPHRLRREGFLDAAIVQRRWRQHLSGQADWSQHLWNVLAFQSWLEHWPSARDEVYVPPRRVGLCSGVE